LHMLRAKKRGNSNSSTRKYKSAANKQKSMNKFHTRTVQNNNKKVNSSKTFFNGEIKKWLMLGAKTLRRVMR
jgi:hypothetical protein